VVEQSRLKVKTFVVLGMHSGGTSLVAKGLAGSISMGVNPTSNWEDNRFGRLNMAILKAAGGSSFDPPDEAAIMMAGQRFEDRIKETIAAGMKNARESCKARYQPALCWGWKHPTNSLTVRLFHPHIPNPHYIAVFRDPYETALSLSRRPFHPVPDIKAGIALTLEYSRRVMAFLQEVYQ